MYSSLAELVTQRRTALGYTIRQLAARVGVSSAYIAHLEHGSIATPSPPILAALARELLVSEEDLLRVIGHMPPPSEPGNPTPPRQSLVYLLAALVRELPVSEEDLLRAVRYSQPPRRDRILPQQSLEHLLPALVRELHISEGDLLRAMTYLRRFHDPGDPISLLQSLVHLLARELNIKEEDLLLRAIRYRPRSHEPRDPISPLRSSAYIAHIEHGRIAPPSPPLLAALARELDMSEEDLLRAMGYLRPSIEATNLVPPIKSLAQLVKQAREARGLTQAQVDELIGMSTGHTDMVESGRITRPRQETLRKLEIALGIPREDMMVAMGELDAPSEDMTIMLQRIAALPDRQQRLEAWARLPESLRSAVLVLMQDMLLAGSQQPPDE